MENKIQERVRRAYQSGYEHGKKAKETEYPDGVDWHIVGITCDCGQEVCPVADNAGEDIKLYELLAEYRGKKCEVCGKFYRLPVEEGTMASKKEGWSPKND